MFEFKDGTKYQEDNNKEEKSGIEGGQSFIIKSKEIKWCSVGRL